MSGAIRQRTAPFGAVKPRDILQSLSTLLADKLVPDPPVLQPVLDAVVAIFTILGVPVAIGSYLYAKRRERIDREIGTYATLQQHYVDFLKLAFENPNLPIYGVVGARRELTPSEVRKIECSFLILISLIESAYLLYRQHGSAIRESQWRGWQEYIVDYFKNPYFREMWPDLGRQFDGQFFNAINGLVEPASRNGNG